MYKNIYLTAAVGIIFIQGISQSAIAAPMCSDLFFKISSQYETTENTAQNKLQSPTSPYLAMPHLELRNYILKESIKASQNRRMEESRGLSKYNDALGRDDIFLKTLNSVIENQKTWIDVGGGNGYAIQETINNYIPNNQLPKLRSILISVDTKTKSTDQMTVLTGRYFEDISNSELDKGGLITDVYGAMSYSSEPHIVLRKYWELLANQGKALIYQGANGSDFGKNNKVITRDGQVLELRDWAVSVFKGQAKINTFVVESENNGLVEMNTLIIEKNDQIQIQIPELEIISFKAGLPPTFLFKEKGESLADKNSIQSAVRKKSYEAVAHKKNKMFAPDFLDAFRSGAWSNPVIARISKLQKQDSWLNVGPLATAIGYDLAARNSAKAGTEEKYDFNSHSDFLWLDQKIMERRALGIQLHQFKYEATKNLDQLKTNKKFELITDYYGDFVMQSSPVETLKRYAQLLKPQGRIFIAMGSEDRGLGQTSKILFKDGREISLRDWVTGYVPGISAKFYRVAVGREFGTERSFVEIKITDMNKLMQALDLGLVGFHKNKNNDPAVPLFLMPK